MLMPPRSNRRHLLSTLLPLALVLSSVAAACAQTVIDHLPYTISTKGVYVLNSDLTSAQTGGNLIEIKASNVTLDFQGHFISGPTGNTGLNTNGVYAYERSNITLKNGTIAFCYQGIDIEGNNAANTNAVGELVDTMRVTYCYYIGIFVYLCPASRIQNCQVSQTGYSGAGSAYAIYTNGSGETIQNNTVSTVTSNNSFGVYAPSSFVRQNTISGAKYGVYGGKYQDNLTISCTTPFSNGTDAGGNN